MSYSAFLDNLCVANNIEKFTQQPIYEVHHDLLFVLPTTNTGYHAVHMLKWLNKDPVDPDTQAPIRVEDYEACCSMVDTYVSRCIDSDIDVPEDVKTSIERAKVKIAKEQKRIAANKKFDQIVLGQPLISPESTIQVEHQLIEVPFVAMEFKFARNPYYSQSMETCIAITLSPNHTLDEICSRLAAIRTEFKTEITDEDDEDIDDDDDDPDYVDGDEDINEAEFGGHTSQLAADLEYIMNNDSSLMSDDEESDDDDDDDDEIEFNPDQPDYVMEHSQSLSPQESAEDDAPFI